MRKIVGVAFFIYAVILGAGGTAYYVLSQQPPKQPPVQQEQAAQQPSAQEQAQAQAEEQRRAQERAEKRRQEAERNQRMNALIEKLGFENAGGATFYGYPSDALPQPGLYFRPYVCYTGQSASIQIDIFYHYEITDGTDTAWIHGNRFALICDGTRADFVVEPKKRHDAIAPDASGLSEHVVLKATPAMLDMIQNAALADTVSIQYYNTADGKARTQTLSSSAMEHLRDVVALYNLMVQSSES